ncbi:hypothetical protein [Rhizobium leguminosarum]|uniref:hypothetical protein n=1 Tax=Rhizobium leguminosarum TaxID=384 RepID=UPI0012BCB1D4|nr:hypothetical protein [Rhizobium leguminosarum]
MTATDTSDWSISHGTPTLKDALEPDGLADCSSWTDLACSHHGFVQKGQGDSDEMLTAREVSRDGRLETIGTLDPLFTTSARENVDL